MPDAEELACVKYCVVYDCETSSLDLSDDEEEEKEKGTCDSCQWRPHCRMGILPTPHYFSELPGRPAFLSVDWPLWSCCLKGIDLLNYSYFFTSHWNWACPTVAFQGAMVLQRLKTLTQAPYVHRVSISFSEGYETFTLSHWRRRSFNVGAEVMEFTEKCEKLETSPCNCSGFFEPWKCIVATHPLARSAALCRTTSLHLFGSNQLYKGYCSFSKDYI